MATLAYRQAKIGGTNLVLPAASVGGDKVSPSQHGVVLFRNGDAASKTVTVATPGVDKYGQARPDIAITVPANTTAVIGPFPADLGDTVGDGLVALTYSAVTNCTVDAVSL
ncbi:hypothetical protein [Nocardioides speluncae]|uniref:hypothetical protein n=1 Tax=Nocardioides speluncae TaxID=2670337 RepID=UPI000D69F403|nr:hypothetical protein [Nocardioides speluncae]